MTAAERLSIASRVFAAVIGGYAATGLAAAAMARWLPLSKAEATHAATLVSFLIYVAIVLAVFHAATARRAWTLIGAICGLSIGVFIAGGAQ